MADERNWVIGSANDCDLVINDPKVSRHHCRLTQSGETFTLEDLFSTNGTFVNGERIRAKLTVGKSDEITLGRKVLMPWPDERVQIELTIGREDDNNIIIRRNTVSGHHAKLIISDDGSMIEDLDSTNGTAIGSIENKVKRAKINPDDVIFFGSLSVRAAVLLDRRGDVSSQILETPAHQPSIGDGQTHDGSDDGTSKQPQQHSDPEVGLIADAEPDPPEEVAVGAKQELSAKKNVEAKDAPPKQEAFDVPENSPSDVLDAPIDEKEPRGRETSKDLPSALSNLEDELVALKVLTTEEWKQAVDAVGPKASVPAVLNELGQMRARWPLNSSEEFPVLTSYQKEKILAGEADSLRLDNYLIIERIAGGGMGEIFKARNLKLSRIEAIKTIATEGQPTGSMETDGRQRFKREAQILAALNHPNVSTVYDSGYHGDIAFIAMEYIRGEDMKQIVERTGDEHVPVRWAIDQIIKVADALAHAHEMGVVHRDIKPGNVMISENNDLKVLDMGIAKIKNPVGMLGGSAALTITQASTALGTPEVMPPEQWTDATRVTAESDIYSLGCTFYYMLTGEMPFSTTNLADLMLAHVNVPPEPVGKVRSDCPRCVDQVLAKMMAKKPEDRYRTARELIAALEDCKAQMDKPNKVPMLVVVLVVAAVVGGSAIWFFTR